MSSPNSQPPQHQQQLQVNGIEESSTAAAAAAASGRIQQPPDETGAMPLLLPLTSDADERRIPGGTSPAAAPLTTTSGTPSRPVGGTRSSLVGANGAATGRPKTCSVHIVEPLPTRGSRTGVDVGYSVIKCEEKHGILQRAIPVMPVALAVFACVLNIVLPGTGK